MRILGVQVIAGNSPKSLDLSGFTDLTESEDSIGSPRSKGLSEPKDPVDSSKSEDSDNLTESSGFMSPLSALLGVLGVIAKAPRGN